MGVSSYFLTLPRPLALLPPPLAPKLGQARSTKGTQSLASARGEGTSTAPPPIIFFGNSPNTILRNKILKHKYNWYIMTQLEITQNI